VGTNRGTNFSLYRERHLPMLLHTPHSDPSVVLAICVGVGNTSAAIVTQCPSSSHDIVEA
jgi:hypothetical protein